MYGNSIQSLTEDIRNLKIENPNKNIEYSLLSSNFHIEITPADNEYDDRHIIQHTVKEIA